MKKYFGNLLAFMIVALLLFLTTGCTVPSPIYGTWSDNTGNQITFLNDGTFFSTINVFREDPGENEERQLSEAMQGTYTAIDNALIINVTTPRSATINTEWDLRGAMLYLTWTWYFEEIGEMVQLKLELYHNSK